MNVFINIIYTVNKDLIKALEFLQGFKPTL